MPHQEVNELGAKIALVAGSLLVCFLLTEISFRALAVFSPAYRLSLQQQLETASARNQRAPLDNAKLADLVRPSSYPDIVYELKPNLTGTFQRKSLRLNSLGLRAREFSLEKPANTVRIVGLGDSIMFGWGVEENETYLSLIEQKLTASGARVEVLNFAVPGYNTAIEAAVFEHKAAQFSPDLVIMHFVNNDFTVPAFMQRPENPYALDKSFFADYIRTRLGLRILENADDFGMDHAKHTGRTNRYNTAKQYRYMLGGQGYRDAMSRLAALTTAKGIPVIIVMGSAEPSQVGIVRRTAKKHGFKVVEVKPYVERYVAEHGLQAAKAAGKKIFQVSRADSHPNALGHTIYAAALLDEIARLNRPEILQQLH